MLYVDLVKEQSLRIAVAFMAPVSKKIQEHPHFAATWKQLSEANGFNVHTKDDLLTGFDIPIESMINVVKKVRPELDEFQMVFWKKIQQIKNIAVNEQIEVDHHQHPFDTTERHWEFILNQDYFFDYVLNRIYWQLSPKYDVISIFPLHVDIETANTCNMNCPMCYRHMMDSVGQMKLDLFKSLIDECAKENVYSVRLSWRGEPLTHPDIKEMISYATQRIPNVSFLTNAFYLTEDVIECLVESQLSYVAVSFDGVLDTYEKIRHPAKFEESRGRLQALLDRRARSNSNLPQVRLCTIWPAIRNSPEQYKELMTPVSDYMVYNPYINFKGKMTLKEGFTCQYPWQRIMVAWNGDVQCCTGWNANDIILGNASRQSIKEFWQSERLDEIRHLHAQGKRMDLASCAECRHGCVGDSEIDLNSILSTAT